MAPMEELRVAIEELAAMDRASCSPGEHRAAERIAHALRRRGVAAAVERVRVHGTYWWPLGITSAAGILAALAGRRGHRLTAGLLGLAAGAAVVDDLMVGRRWLRRVLPQQETANVVGRWGDPGATRTLLLVSHHDAAHTSVFFDPRLTAAVGALFAGEPSAPPRQPPLMAPIAAAPVVAGIGGLLGARRLSTLGALVCAGIIGSFVEMANRRTVPGANDNLTGVATLLGVAASLQAHPVEGLEVLFVSTGSEEALMTGMAAFAERHFADLDPARTDVICVDTVGSPHLVLPEAEGMVRVLEYDGGLKDLLARCAEEAGITLGRGMRMRLGTDGYVALRHGFRAAMLMSVDEHGASSNYHWPTDTPDRVDYDRLADAVQLCTAAARRLAAAPASAPA